MPILKLNGYAKSTIDTYKQWLLISIYSKCIVFNVTVDATIDVGHLRALL